MQYSKKGNCILCIVNFRFMANVWPDVISKKMTTIQQIEKLALGKNGFLVKMRALDGVDYEQGNELVALIKQLAKEYKKNELVPKKDIAILIDLIPTLDSFAESRFYANEQERIFILIDRVSKALRECFKWVYFAGCSFKTWAAGSFYNSQ